jgi:hypothetical protein
VNPRTEWVRNAAAVLHRGRCRSLWWSQDCRAPDGGRHARATWRPMLVRALATPDPMVEIHDAVCDVQLDAAAGPCPVRQEHIARLVEILGPIP